MIGLSKDSFVSIGIPLLPSCSVNWIGLTITFVPIKAPSLRKWRSEGSEGVFVTDGVLVMVGGSVRVGVRVMVGVSEGVNVGVMLGVGTITE